LPTSTVSAAKITSPRIGRASSLAPERASFSASSISGSCEALLASENLAVEPMVSRSASSLSFDHGSMAMMFCSGASAPVA
jgi:hypothetical protein